MRIARLALLALIGGSGTAFAQDDASAKEPLYELINAFEKDLDNDELADAIAKKLKAHFNSLLEDRKPELLEQLFHESGDLARFLGPSAPQRRKLKLAARGTFLRLLRQESERYAANVDKWRQLDHRRFRYVARGQAVYGPLPSPGALATSLLDSGIWRKSLARVAGDRSDEFEAMLQQRRQRWRRGVVAHRVSVLDRQLVLSDAQVEKISQLCEAALSDRHQLSRVTSRIMPGISGEQFWGREARVDPKAINELLTPTQRQSIKERGTLAHFRFNGTLEDESTLSALFEETNTQLRRNALYLDGDYSNSNSTPDGIFTPAMSPKSFTVCLRVKPEDLVNDNIVCVDSRRRFFSLRANGNQLEVTLSNQDFKKSVGISIWKGRWSTLACSVDMHSRKILVSEGHGPVVEVEVPEGLRFQPKRCEWRFTNYSNGSVFHGLVDEFLVIDRALTAGELAALPITHSLEHGVVSRREAAGPAIRKALRTRARLWLDHAANVCSLNQEQVRDVERALNQFDNQRFQNWLAKKLNVDLRDPRPYRDVIESHLPAASRDAYRTAILTRDERIAEQEIAYVDAVLDNKLLFSPMQRTKLTPLIRQAVLDQASEVPANVWQVVEQLFAEHPEKILDETQQSVIRDLKGDADSIPQKSESSGKE